MTLSDPIQKKKKKPSKRQEPFLQLSQDYVPRKIPPVSLRMIMTKNYIEPYKTC